MKHLYPHNAPFSIKTQHDTRLYLLRFDDGRLVQPEVQPIAFLIHFESHPCLASLLSKNSVTIPLGRT
jgi:hypothetical protein